MNMIHFGYLIFMPPKESGQAYSEVKHSFTPLTPADYEGGMEMVSAYRRVGPLEAIEAMQRPSASPMVGKTIHGIFYPKGKDETDVQFDTRLGTIAAVLKGQ